MASLAVVLSVRAMTGSFAVAGGAAAVFAISVAVLAPVRGRVIDRFGQAAVLLPLAVVQGGALVGLDVLGGSGGAVGVCVLAGLAGGVAPPVAASMGAL